MNEKNSNDCVINVGKLLVGNIIPIKMEEEKSGLGKNNKPKNNPISIDEYAFFSLIFLL